MKIIPSEQVTELITIKKQVSYRGIIDSLPQGAALRIAPGEWRYKSSIPMYFLGLMNRGGKKRVSVVKMPDNCYYVIKLV